MNSESEAVEGVAEIPSKMDTAGFCEDSERRSERCPWRDEVRSEERRRTTGELEVVKMELIVWFSGVAPGRSFGRMGSDAGCVVGVVETENGSGMVPFSAAKGSCRASWAV